MIFLRCKMLKHLFLLEKPIIYCNMQNTYLLYYSLSKLFVDSRYLPISSTKYCMNEILKKKTLKIGISNIKE